MRELNKLTEYICDKKLVISHKRVESIEEIPKLKLIIGWSSKPKQTPLYRTAIIVLARISIW